MASTRRPRCRECRSRDLAEVGVERAVEPDSIDQGRRVGGHRQGVHRLFHTFDDGKSGQFDVGGAAITGPCRAENRTTSVRQADANFVTHPLGDIGRPGEPPDRCQRDGPIGIGRTTICRGAGVRRRWHELRPVHDQLVGGPRRHRRLLRPWGALVLADAVREALAALDRLGSGQDASRDEPR